MFTVLIYTDSLVQRRNFRRWADAFTFARGVVQHLLNKCKGDNPPDTEEGVKIIDSQGNTVFALTV